MRCGFPNQAKRAASLAIAVRKTQAPAPAIRMPAQKDTRAGWPRLRRDPGAGLGASGQKPQKRAGLPRQWQEKRNAHRRSATKPAQRSPLPHRKRKQKALRHSLQILLLIASYKSRRPSMAFIMVTSSAYSKSAPTGIPTPIRVTRDRK